MTKTKQQLRFGSRGEDVELLQAALNIRAQSLLADLVEDGIFGGMTSAKVVEFQKQEGTVADAIVGPKTWEKLAKHVDEVLKLITPPAHAEAASNRIIAQAEAALFAFGWPGEVQLDPNSPRIAAALRSDPAQDPGPRQGGRSLQHIFMIAGALPRYTDRCATLTSTAENHWRLDAQSWRNSHDLPAWCGIFAFYIYRCAGISLPGGWLAHNVTSANRNFQKQILPKRVVEGSIGVIDGIRKNGRNHHFIVVRNDKDARVLRTIDGNCFGPLGSKGKGNRSVIARREYTYTDLRAKDAYFLFPKL